MKTKATGTGTAEAKAEQIAAIINKYGKEIPELNATVEGRRVFWFYGSGFQPFGWAYVFGMYELAYIKQQAAEWVDECIDRPKAKSAHRLMPKFCEELKAAFDGWLIDPCDGTSGEVDDPYES